MRFRVLIVDDEREIADYICELVNEVTSDQAETEVFYSGMKALQRLKEASFDLVVSDISMPVTDGFAILKYVAANCKDCKFIFLSIYAEFDYIYQANRLKNIDYIVKTETAGEIKKVFEKNLREIEEERRRHKSGRSLEEREKLQVHADASQKEKELIEQVCRYIEENLDSELSVAYLAEGFHYNASYLSRLFKKHTGEKLSNYILSRKLGKAKEYLAGTDYPVSKIASMLGYQSSQAFGRVFRKEVHMTPQEYRRW